MAAIKKGVLQKRSQGKSTLGQLLPSWQSRLFVLTSGDFLFFVLMRAENLTYYDEAGREVKGAIPLARILAVEPVSVSAFVKPNVFQVSALLFQHSLCFFEIIVQVIHPESTLYVYSESADDYDQWMAVLRKEVGFLTTFPEVVGRQVC
jgi:hypothetical protein